MDAIRRIVAVTILSLGLFSTAKGEDVADLIDQLGSWRKSKCIEASNKLAAMGKPVVPEVAKVVNSKGRRKGRFAVRTLRNIGQDAAGAIPELFDALDDSDALTRKYAVEALAEMPRQADRIIPVLKKVTNSGDEDLSEQAKLAIDKLTALSKSQSQTESLPQTGTRNKDMTNMGPKEPSQSESTDTKGDSAVSNTHSETKSALSWPGPVGIIRIALLTFVIGGFFLLLYVYRE